MGKTKDLMKRMAARFGGCAVMAAAALFLFSSIAIHAEAATAKVTASSVRVRKEASTDSDVVGGASNGVTATGVKYTPPARFKDPTNFVWDALDPTWTEDGTVLTLTFDVSATAAKGAYPITLSCDPYDVIDGNGAPIDFDIANAVIEVQ